MEDVLEAVIVLTILAGVYFLPTFVAVTRDHSNIRWIAVVNFLLGWSLVGWAVALAMATKKTSVEPKARVLSRAASAALQSSTAFPLACSSCGATISRSSESCFKCSAATAVSLAAERERSRALRMKR
jgi:hypothetical protein